MFKDLLARPEQDHDVEGEEEDRKNGAPHLPKIGDIKKYSATPNCRGCVWGPQRSENFVETFCDNIARWISTQGVASNSLLY